MSKTSPVIVNEIRRLSQEEGLKDCEIADIIGYSRGGVQRIRKENNIPTYNYVNRKDKEMICSICKKKYYIKRTQKRSLCCSECEEKINHKIMEHNE